MSHACVIVALDPETKDVEAAVEDEMAPFQEREEWFEDGSRWDWFQIGGRWTGHFDGYEPAKDPANLSRCELCRGTGTRPDMDCAWCGGCNGCKGTGEKIAWPTQWKRHPGDVARKAGMKEDVTAFAFLRNYQWHEAERMGFFGGTAATECQRAGSEPHICKFVHRLPGGASRMRTPAVVSWGAEQKDWDAKFYHRFIRTLPDGALLVAVDYHV